MRKGSVSIVPLVIAIMFIFWFMMFMGFENDNLSKINRIENIQNLEERLLYAAMQKKYEIQREYPELSETEVDAQVQSYVETVMLKNKM